MLKRITFILIAVILCGTASVAWIGCNRTHSQDITLSERKITLAPDSTRTLTVTSKHEQDTNFIWKSDPDTIVSVDKNGKITALKAGKATVTVTVKGTEVNATCEVKVEKNSDFNWMLLLLGIVGLIVCTVARFKYWNKINLKNKDKIFLIACILFVLLGLFAWQTVRIVFYWLVGIAVLGIVIYFVIKQNKKGITKSTETKNKTGKIGQKQYENLQKTYEALEKDYKRLEDENKKLQENTRMLLAERNDWERKYKTLEKQAYADQTRNDEQHKTVVPVSPAPEQKNEFSTATTLYAKSIIDGKFYGVKELPDEDTIFELKLNKSVGMQANVTVYTPAHSKIIANPSYLEGCEKQILGNSAVKIVQEGKATKDESGNWKIIHNHKLNIIIE